MTADNANFVAKLRQIEELAAEVHAELPPQMLRLRTRVQHIVVLAKTLRGRFELGGLMIVQAQPAGPGADEPKKPPL